MTELFIRGRKINISVIAITQSYFAAPKNIKQNSTYYFILKISNEQELPQITFNHSSGIDFEDFMKNLLQHHIFWWMILLLHQIDLYVFRKQLIIRLEMKNYNTILTSLVR